MKKIISIIIFLLFFKGTAIAEAVTDTYVASPIIFVHGFGPGNWESWGNDRVLLKKYFVDEQKSELKYDYINLDKVTIPYFPFPYLEYPGNGGVDEAASSCLLPVIKQALDVMPDCTSTERKVILVAHSMGGLVVRDFLKKYPQYAKNSIKKVIFVGTPHQGSPLANFTCILNQAYHAEELTGLIKEQKFKSIDVGKPSLRIAKHNSESEENHTFSAHQNLVRQLEDFKFILGAAHFALNKFGINPDGKAMEHLRLSKYNISFQRMFQGVYKYSTTEPIYFPSEPYVVEGGSTFLGKENLPMPADKNYEIESLTVTSQKPPQKSDIEKGLDLTSNLKLGFHFPSEENLMSIKTSGDGIVSLASQSNGQGIAPSLNVFHTDEPGAYASQILNALDDSPVIENMYVAKWPATPAQIVVKVKDYLLADIEIASITVDGTPLDLATVLDDFNDGTGHYKPYVKFNKQFLMERVDSSVLDKNSNATTLYPGEFYVALELDVDNSHVIDIDIKNPSNNLSIHKSLTIATIQYIGGWDVDMYTGEWENFHYGTSAWPTILMGGIRYNNGSQYNPIDGEFTNSETYQSLPSVAGLYGSGANLYKIDIPRDKPIDNIDIVLKIGSSYRNYCIKRITYFIVQDGLPSAYPPDIAGEIKIDYSFTSPVGASNPIGEHTLHSETIGGTLQYGQSVTSYDSERWVTTSIPLQTLKKTVYINNPSVETLWVTIYPSNAQSMISQIKPYADAVLFNTSWKWGWGFSVGFGYEIEGVIFNYKQ